MQRLETLRMGAIRRLGEQPGDNALPSGNSPHTAQPAIPDFVEAAVATGVPRAAAEALSRKIAQARADVRARRITPAGGIRRVERLALVVAIVAPLVGAGS